MAIVAKMSKLRRMNSIKAALFGSSFSADVLRDDLLSWSHQSVRRGIGRARNNKSAQDDRNERLKLYAKRVKKKRDVFTGEKVDCTSTDLLF